MTERLPNDAGMLSRRRLLAVSGYSALAVAAGGLAAGCVRPPAAAFNPATQNWLADLAKAIAADAVANILDGGLKRAWSAWTDGVHKSVEAQPDYPYHDPTGWVHGLPPTALLGVTREKYGGRNPLDDRLVACVQGGRKAVVFEAWAWQALAMFVHDMTNGRQGADLAAYQTLCALCLVPSGVRPASGGSPQGSVGWLTYNAKVGEVELARFEEPDGSVTVSVKAKAIPDGSGHPTRKKFTLPTEPADA